MSRNGWYIHLSGKSSSDIHGRIQLKIVIRQAFSRDESGREQTFILFLSRLCIEKVLLKQWFYETMEITL